MAAKQTKKSGKSTSGAKKPAQSARGAKQAPQPKPVRREVGAVVCFFLALFTFIGYFNVDALFITYICRFIKGLIGYGYYIFPPVLAVCAFVLAFHRGRPVAARTVCALLMPIVFGALVHVVFSHFDAAEMKFADLVSGLYKSGAEMKCGGALAGLLAAILIA